MREIKFRAWCRRRNKIGTKQNEMGMCDVSLQGLMNIHSTDFAFTLTGERGYNERYVLHDETILMQYTGLKDKNDVEIYEGDIIESIFNYANKEPRFVVYNEEECRFLQMDKSGHYIYNKIKDITVIGNIYENKDLIK